ncbi:glucokinase [Desulfosarcina widdelii]|uniref:Glucokinase n=1 Tax=Desulfosarcina widdelii TaxID=947919 RepID=A0A5K7ZB45_9BACT|nr:glucokinase [Desulfosarcina widdelii]BBO79066.1 glucokinase [Desulfosarcina widdelii]
MILTIDIGGTHTRLAMVDEDASDIRLEHFRSYRSEKYRDVDEIIQDYETSIEIKAKSAVVGVPGPVLNGTARATNLPWELEEKGLAERLCFSSVKLINDVEALGYTIGALAPDDLVMLNPGRHYPDAPATVIAPGTGLGEAYVLPAGSRHRIFPSEGGHSGFAPSSKMELKLLEYLMADHDHVSVESICSGPGICNIYRFLRDRQICIEPQWLKEALEKSADQAGTIAQNALSADKAEAISIQTLELFVAILGAESGNLALMLAAKNGVYIGGGIAPQILPFLQKDLFMQSFLNKGPMSRFVADIPVSVICKPDANLYGLASFARKGQRGR